MIPCNCRLLATKFCTYAIIEEGERLDPSVAGRYLPFQVGSQREQGYLEYCGNKVASAKHVDQITMEEELGRGSHVLRTGQLATLTIMPSSVVELEVQKFSILS